MMIYGAYRDADSNERGKLYFEYSEFFRDTFSPDCEVLAVIEFKTSGRTYQERKEAAQALAIDYNMNSFPGMSWGAVAAVQGYFERIGRRYGLLKEFRENAIC